jgi:hypothetical protein
MTPMTATSALALGLALLSTPCTAQTPVPRDTTLGDTLMVKRALGGDADSFRVDLAKGGQYRLLLVPGSASLTAVSADKRASAAFAARVREGAGWSPSIIELYPPRNATYTVTVSAAGGLAGGSLELWSDRQLAEAKREARDREWGVGGSVAGGWHSGYYTGADDANGGQAGSVIEACLLVGNSGRASGCLGFTSQQMGSPDNGVTWFFLEPRLSVASFRVAGRPMDVLLSARIGQGNSARLAVDPSMIAPGGILSYHLDDRPGARGWRVNLEVLYALLGNTSTTLNTNFAQVTLGLAWIP